MARRRRRLLWTTGILAALVAGVFGLWIAIHEVPWLGPLLADSARAILGPEAVAKAEDAAYGAQDRWNRAFRSDEAPQPYWDVPEIPASASVAPPSSATPLANEFRPRDVGPVFASTQAKGDGVWIPIKEAACGPRACMYKTVLHPDRNRGWAVVAIAAIDTTTTRLHLVPGVEEPRATQPEARNAHRPGLVPDHDRDKLIAAFNGGFKTEHGTLGMQVGGLTFVGPQPWGCTIARLADGSLSVAPWSKLRTRLDAAAWWRQTPSCLVDDGTFARGVHAEANINWGKAVSGETIIRRSAIGLDASGRTLFVGIGDSTSAGSIATAMAHAGARSVAQLDVNWSYPKFLVFEREQTTLVARPLCPGFQFSEQDYVGVPARRDFFYVTRLD